jgi:hypothetical protein
MDEEKLIILVQGPECLYNLQHKDYDNSVVKDDSWKEIAGELHVQYKIRNFHEGHCTVGEWHGSGRGTAWYESAFRGIPQFTKMLSAAACADLSLK